MEKSIKERLIIKKKFLMLLALGMLIMIVLSMYLNKQKTNFYDIYLYSEMIVIFLFSSCENYRYTIKGSMVLGNTRKCIYSSIFLLNGIVAILIFVFQSIIVTLSGGKISLLYAVIFFNIAIMGSFLGIVLFYHKRKAKIILIFYYFIFIALCTFMGMYEDYAAKVLLLYGGVIFTSILAITSVIWGWNIIKNYDLK